MQNQRVYLRYLTHYLPERILDNRFFEGILDTMPGERRIGRQPSSRPLPRPGRSSMTA